MAIGRLPSSFRLYPLEATITVVFPIAITTTSHESGFYGFFFIPYPSVLAFRKATDIKFFAEIVGAEVFLTCDDAVLRCAQRLLPALRVLDPVAYLTGHEGSR
jgi:hypothetical protein